MHSAHRIPVQAAHKIPVEGYVAKWLATPHRCQALPLSEALGRRRIRSVIAMCSEVINEPQAASFVASEEMGH
jgi:hypothetical protein